MIKLALLLAIPALCAAGLHVIKRFSWFNLGILFTLTSLTLLPIRIPLTSNSFPDHTGIASSTWDVTNYGLAIAVTGLAISLMRIRNSYILLLPITSYILLGILYLWPDTGLTPIGAVHWFLTTLVFHIGVTAGHKAALVSSFRSFLTLTICGLVLIQCAFGLLQVVGYDVRPVSEGAAEWVQGRVNGLTAHPNTLGKILFLTTIMLLPLASQTRGLVSRVAYGSIFLSIIVIALTGGRANFIAAMSALTLWALLAANSRLATKAALFLGVLATGAAFYTYYAQRFAEDPVGGGRQWMQVVANALFDQNRLFGLGLNNYVAVGGAQDRYTASGFPVHNAAMLTLVEIGIVGAVCIAIPLVCTAIGTIRTSLTPSHSGSQYARSVVMALPGILLVGLTGFGFAASPTLYLLALVIGFGASGSFTPTPVLIRDDEATNTFDESPAPAPEPALCGATVGATASRSGGIVQTDELFTPRGKDISWD